MLSSLSIQNFVIVDRLELSFEPGMSVLSGETGAGKSILIDALSLCLGARADASQVRQGCDRAHITAEFDCNGPIITLLDELAIEAEDGLYLRRTIDSSGRSRAFVNGVGVPLSTLKALAEHLIEIHGQHAFQSLVKPASQLALLDHFGQYSALTQATRTAYRALETAQNRLANALIEQQDTENRLRILEWQLEALDPINPQESQWESLVQQHDLLSHGAELLEGAQATLNQLSQQDNSLLEQVGQALQHLDRMAQTDPALQGLVSTLTESEILLREANSELGQYLKKIDLNPTQLNEIERQISEWHETARKLKTQPHELPELHQKLKTDLEHIQSEPDLMALEEEVQKTKAQYTEVARKLSAARAKSAKKLSQCVSHSMQELAMKGGVFEVSLSACKPCSTGSETAEFLVAGHAGVRPQALAKVASGGELARISLAITVNTVESSPVPSLVFDEVDSGIGGAVAHAVGKYLRQLSLNKQVLCVTHLPQVASQGHTHLQVTKTTRNNITQSTIEQLTDEQRVQEVARMLGGAEISKATKQAAQDMLASASKSSW